MIRGLIKGKKDVGREYGRDLSSERKMSIDCYGGDLETGSFMEKDIDSLGISEGGSFGL
jgi:hypothetical protein